MSKFIAIGDIHGFHDSFEDLWSRVESHVTPDTIVVFLGDYVDGGGKTRQVLEWMQTAQRENPHWVFLRGNHEDMLLKAMQNPRTPGEYMDMYVGHSWDHWYYQGGRETLDSYPDGVKGIKNDLLWLDTLPYFYDTEKFFFVHAGVPGKRGIENVVKDAGRDDLIGQTAREQLTWVRDEFIKSKQDYGKRVIFGHTYHREPVVQKNKIGIDTMHHGGGMITAVLLDSENPDEHTFIHSKVT